MIRRAVTIIAAGVVLSESLVCNQSIRSTRVALARSKSRGPHASKHWVGCAGGVGGENKRGRRRGQRGRSAVETGGARGSGRVCRRGPQRLVWVPRRKDGPHRIPRAENTYYLVTEHGSEPYKG
jgi:hypothetical protein